MTKRLLSAAAVALLSASVAQAATITYTLQVDDANVAGNGSWGLYADVSNDCGGLVAYNVALKSSVLDLSGGAFQLSPAGLYKQTLKPTLAVGFTLLRSASASGSDFVFTGSQDVPAAGTNGAVLIYGFGQTAGDLQSKPPMPSTYNTFVNSSDGGSTYTAHLLLAAGFYNAAAAHATVSDWFDTTVANNGNVFNAAGNTANSIVNASLAIAGVTSTTNTNTDSLSATTVGTPDVTLNVVRKGAGAYVPTVALVNGGTGLVKGTANIVGPITEAPIWVMAKIIGTDAANVIGVLPNQTATAGELADLHAKYDALFPGGSFNALFKFTSPASAGSFSWDMTGWNAQVSALAAVPEPASLGLVALGALGLLARRRK